jgi:hypothetical protein
MKFIKQNLILSFAILGLLTSLGAPLGFYIHDYYFGNHASQNIMEHFNYLHQKNLTTLLYIGLGSNIFFSFFGGLVGAFTDKLLKQNKRLEDLRDSKQNLMTHLHSRMRKATTLGLEGLYYLKKDVLGNHERMVIINETIKELKLIDESVQNLGLLRKNSSENIYCSVEEVVALLIETSAKFEQPFLFENESHSEAYKILARPKLLELAFDVIFEWASIHEIPPIQFSYTFNEGALKLEFHFALETINETFSRHLLQEMVEHNSGHCIIGNNFIHILLPTKNADEKESAA